MKYQVSFFFYGDTVNVPVEADDKEQAIGRAYAENPAMRKKGVKVRVRLLSDDEQAIDDRATLQFAPAKKSGQHGGKRPGAGRKPGPRKRLELDADTAISLYQLTRLRSAALDKPELSEEDVVKALVEAEWEKVEAELLPAEEAKEPFIL